MCESDVPGPERPADQLAAALGVLRSSSETDLSSVRHACAVILNLSKDPFDRMLAEEVLRQMPD